MVNKQNIDQNYCQIEIYVCHVIPDFDWEVWKFIAWQDSARKFIHHDFVKCL